MTGAVVPVVGAIGRFCHEAWRLLPSCRGRVLAMPRRSAAPAGLANCSAEVMAGAT